MVLYGSTPDDLARAAALLRSGALVAFPTETVYGLGADASDARALARLFAAKGRPADHPVIVHLARADAVGDWASEIPAPVSALAARFWPGPLTLILKRAPGVLDAVTGGQDTVGLRVPGHPVARALLEAFGGGLAAPSANRFGRVSPTTAAHVIAELGDAVDAVVDGGPCAVGLESTILDLSGGVPRLLRPGAVSADMLAEVLGSPIASPSPGGTRAPGGLPSHYAPDTPLRLLDAAGIVDAARGCDTADRPVAVLSPSPPPADVAGVRWIAMPDDPREYGRILYARLREVDSWGCCGVLVERPPADAAWDAVRDRLRRAAGEAQPEASPRGGR